MSDMDSNLWAGVTAWENLVEAYRKAARGKRGRLAAAAFEHRMADRLLDIESSLRHRTYRPGGYRHFIIHEPKRRKISAAPFRDRVVHHALCNVIEPIFEDRFHPHSYANRRGKGTHRAVDHLQVLARRHRYVLRADVRQHFASLDHAILHTEIAKVIPDESILWLVDRILAGGAGVLDDVYNMTYFPGDDLLAATRPRGLPIGNLTSQFWSNCYLNPFDWFVARQLGCAAYVRYVDDFALFADDKRTLWEWHRAIVTRMARLRLTLHPVVQVAPCAQGIPWLGFVVYPSHRRVKRRNVINARRRLTSRIDAYARGRITFAELDASVQGWINHVRYADTWGLRQNVLDSMPPIIAPKAASGSEPQREEGAPPPI